MKKFAIYTSLIVAIVGCTATPEPIQYGRDSCHHCKMLIMDPKFGAEIVTEKGKIYKFDDINCLLAFRDGKEMEDIITKHYMVVDFLETQVLTDATHAHFFISTDIKSPMASGVASFEDKEALNEFIVGRQGRILDWAQLQSEFR